MKIKTSPYGNKIHIVTSMCIDNWNKVDSFLNEKEFNDALKKGWLCKKCFPSPKYWKDTEEV